jgi:membrane protein DedA with SNARE-associated domain
MTEWLLGLVPAYGIWLVGAATFLSCLALPIPSSVVMLAAGGFVGSGDLALWQVVAAALVGAVSGDQIGYFAARKGEGLIGWLARRPAQAELIGKAQAYARDRGLVAVFFSRWLVSPLGPWVNIAAGVASMSWIAFTTAGVLGEAVWVGLYVGMGQAFGGSIEAASEAIGSLLGMIGAGAAAIAFGWWLLRAARRQTSGPAHQSAV